MGQACKDKDSRRGNAANNAHEAVAILSQPSYASNDTISIILSQKLQQLNVKLDKKPLMTILSDSLNVLLPVPILKVGVYQLVVSGSTPDKTKISDTLSVEIRSDIKPHQFEYRLMMTYPHDKTSFTQGLEFHGGKLYEGTGLNGESKLLRVETTTGRIIQSKPLPKEHFGEGVTIIGDRIYQLTWTSGQCFRYTMEFELDQTYRYYTQGWGLTHKDTTLIVSDGSNRLYFYTPNFERIGDITVYDDKGAVFKLNELEYVNGYVLANVWETNRIVQIDLESGKVIGELNLVDLLPANLNDPKASVLNGIAYDQSEGVLYVTGKNWPALYKLKVKDLLKKGKAAAAIL